MVVAIEAIKSGSGGGLLQAKTAWPSHSEQVIAPDEDYYGLVSVIVKPVPRLPACVASVKLEYPFVSERVVNLGVGVEVIGEDYIQTHALYGGNRLPLLPADVLTQYPYAYIYKHEDDAFYRCVFTTGPWWWEDSGNRGMNLITAETYVVYKADKSSSSWEFLENSTTRFIKFAYFNIWYASLAWTNFNIPLSSASATSYYKTATVPGLTL